MLESLEKQMLGKRLLFRCETQCARGSGCENGTIGFFSYQDYEIVACDCQQGSASARDPFVSETKATLHHELIHAVEAVSRESSPETIEGITLADTHALVSFILHLGSRFCMQRNSSVPSCELQLHVWSGRVCEIGSRQECRQ